jgi:hypothetical protein
MYDKKQMREYQRERRRRLNGASSVWEYLKIIDNKIKDLSRELEGLRDELRKLRDGV